MPCSYGPFANQQQQHIYPLFSLIMKRASFSDFAMYTETEGKILQALDAVDTIFSSRELGRLWILMLLKRAKF